jgi:simple sugar transport system permease protein
MTGVEGLDIFWDNFFWISLGAATIRIAVPILYAALGEIVSEDAGLLNIGIEGMMTMGAWGGFTGAYFFGSVWMGVLTGAVAGFLIGLLMGWLCISRGADQIITGIILNIFCLGIASLTYRKIFDEMKTFVGTGMSNIPEVESFQPYSIPFLGDLKYVGEIFFQHIPLVYIAFLLVLVFLILIYGTSWGLKLRAVGEHPEAADTAGVNVWSIRYLAIGIGGMMAAVGGATLSIGQVKDFVDGMTAGRGFIALAVVVFGGWNPLKVMGGCLLFGFAEAFQLKLQALNVPVPHEFLLMIPYILTIVVLVGSAGKAEYPAATNIPYLKKRAKGKQHARAEATEG